MEEPYFVHRFATDEEARGYGCHGGDLVVARTGKDGRFSVRLGPFRSYDRAHAEAQCRLVNKAAALAEVPDLFAEDPEGSPGAPRIPPTP